MSRLWGRIKEILQIEKSRILLGGNRLPKIGPNFVNSGWNTWWTICKRIICPGYI